MMSSSTPVDSTSAVWKQFALFADVTLVEAMITKAIRKDPVVAL